MSHELFYQHIRSIWNETMGEGFDFNIIILCKSGVACKALNLKAVFQQYSG